MEDLVRNLHQARVSNVFIDSDGLQNPEGIQSDIEHKLLERDLFLQLEAIAAYGTNPYTSTATLPILDGLDEESSESLMVCLAIAGLALLPQLLGN